MITKFKQYKKESFQTVFFSTILVLLVLVVIGFVIVSNWKVSQKRAELNDRIEILKSEIQDLKIEKEVLEARASESFDNSYLEKEARERFNLKKPGEEVVTILLPEEKGESVEEKEKAWWNIFDW
jgi:cell division protein FtsB